MKKRILSLIISAVLIICMIPITSFNTNAVSYMTPSKFTTKLNTFKTSVCKEGSTFVDDPGAYGGYQCFGFANRMAIYIFGSYPTTYSTGRILKSDNWKITHGSNAINNLHVGDIVRYRNSTWNHSIFITKISGDTVYYADANSDWKNTVHYAGNKTTKSKLKTLLNSYIIDEDTQKNLPYKGWVAHYKYWKDVNTLTINYAANGATIAPSNNYTVSTGGSTLTLRGSASTSGTALASIPDNTTLTVTETKSAGGYTWGKTTYNGKTGWCALDYTVRQGYYTSSGKIYKYSNSAIVKTVWDYGTGGANGLYNYTTFGLSRPGYSFAGWCLNSDGSTKIFDQDDTALKAENIYPGVASASKTVTLYAIWTPIYSHSFSFDSNGGTGSINTVSAKLGQTLTLPQNTFTKTNYRFIGWNVKRNTDNKWFVPNHGWCTEEVIASQGYTKKLYADKEQNKLDSTWFDGITVNGSVLFTFYAVWEDSSIESISVTEIEPKTVYYVGNSIDTSKLKVMVKNADGTSETVTSGFTCSPSVFSSEGKQTVTVSYKSYTTTYSVQVTKAKSTSITAKANSTNTCYYLPSADSAGKFVGAAYSGDTCVIFCKEGNYYLGFFPYGASSATASNGFLGYMPISTFGTPSATVPNYTDFYTMNPTLNNNAKANKNVAVYHRPATTSIGTDGQYTSFESLSSGQAIRVLFELNGYYCIRTSKSVGFVIKSAVTLDPVLTGISAVSNAPLTASVGEDFSANGITVKALYSDGTSKAITNYSLTAPNTAAAGEKSVIISYGGFTTFLPVTVETPVITGIEIYEQPIVRLYAVQREFEPSGMSVKVNYSNGTSKNITAGFEVSYDFSEPGNRDVTVSYEGFTASISVTVYESPVVDVCNADGYEGEIVIIPVILSSKVSAYSFSGTVSYDSTNLQYNGFSAGDGINPERFQLNLTESGTLLFAGANDEPIDEELTLFNIMFKVTGTLADVETDNKYPVSLSSFELYDDSSNTYETQNISGYILNMGLVRVIYDAAGGTGEPETAEVVYGNKFTISDVTPTYQNRLFLGWSRTPNEEKSEYSAGDTIECTKEVKLYAVWKDIAVEGQCGEYAVYSLNLHTGVLTVSGEGDMYDYYEAGGFVGEYADAVKSMIIEAGIVSVGDSTFDGLKNLTDISLADTVSSVGALAFSNCTALKKAAVYNRNIAFDESAFKNVSGLTLFGYSDSTVKEYASKQKIPFVSIFIPSAPKVKLVGATKISLEYEEGYEYSIDGINWQDDNILAELTENRLYTVYKRLARDSENTVSTVSEPLRIITNGKDMISEPLNSTHLVWLKRILLSDGNNMAADIDEDGELDIRDLVRMKKTLAEA